MNAASTVATAALVAPNASRRSRIHAISCTSPANPESTKQSRNRAQGSAVALKAAGTVRGDSA